MSLENSRRYDFRYGHILANAPRDSGVFALFREESWLYVGEANSICTGLLDRLEKNRRVSTPEPATSFAFEVCPPEHRTARLVAVVFKHRPMHCDRPEFLLRER